MFSTNQLVSNKQLLLAGVMLSVSNNVYASCVPEPYIGSTCTTAANFCPREYLPADGRNLPISEYSTLYSLLGSYFGGDNRTYFTLPDLRGRSAIGSGYGPGMKNVSLLGFQYGHDTQTLEVENLPAHTHEVAMVGGSVDVQLTAYDGMGTSPAPTGIEHALQGVAQNGFSYNSEAKLYGEGTGNEIPLQGISASYTPPFISIKSTGETKSFSTRSPSLALTYCIAVNGLYPSRN